ncbi:MAG TPA: hypothetical protein VFZ72_22675 [Jiangellaceae bacterium]
MAGAHDNWSYLRELDLQRFVDRMRRKGLLATLPSDAQFVAYCTPYSMSRTYTRCLAEQGFHWQAISSDEPDDWNIPDTDRPAAAEALYRCRVMHPYHPGFDQDDTPERLHRLYDYYVGTLCPCLERLGHNPGPIPTYEYFEAHRGRRTEWSPYALIEWRLGGGAYTSEDRQTLEDLYEQCPPVPDPDVLFDA